MRIDKLPLVSSKPNMTIEFIVLSTVQSAMIVTRSTWTWRRWMQVTDQVFHAVYDSLGRFNENN